MTTLTIFAKEPGKVTRLSRTEEERKIRDELEKIGIRFERWKAEQVLAPGADQEAILKAYGRDVDRLKTADGYQSADVVRMQPDHPEREAMRQKFLSEHTHSEDEVRFFVEGAGAFYLRNDDRVYQVVCTRGDLISVPTGQRHWFDMGPKPLFCAIRLFTSPTGWAANFTGDKIADAVPLYEAA
jgi:1,2-dihydroxy-3-keto-5-methylthiopentene dioxygenase